MKEKGLKYDEGKLRFDLVPPIALLALAQVYTFGAEKYEDDSWQQLDDFEKRYMGALHRHLNAHQMGELRDKESGLYHLDHLLWNVVALRWKLQQDELADQRITIQLGEVTIDNKALREFFCRQKSDLIFTISPEGIPKQEAQVVHDDVETET